MKASPQFGASFSLKYCQEMGVDARECLQMAIDDLGVKRLRLMSYWDVHEPVQGHYDFTQLDWQIEEAEHSGTQVSLALGLRQPRWPESHWPAWAKELPDEQWQQALRDFITEVVNRYKDKKFIVSYQLENEAMLKRFGLYGNFDRKRLKAEFKLVKRLDPTRPVIMTCSDSYGIPFFGPRPDMYGFSIYRYFYDKGQYRHSGRSAWFYHIRANVIRLAKLRRVFIHELQAEPWGPKATVEMPLDEQFKSINPARVKEAVEYAKHSTLLPADLWGLEWWYWLKTKHDKPEIWDYLKTVFSE